MKRTKFIIGAVVVSAIAFVIYVATRTPEAVVPMGDETATIAWISLAIAILSLATAVVGLVQKLVELRAAKRG